MRTTKFCCYIGAAMVGHPAPWPFYFLWLTYVADIIRWFRDGRREHDRHVRRLLKYERALTRGLEREADGS